MRILIPVDGSQAAERTLCWAARMFAQGRNRFYLLLVIPQAPAACQEEQWTVSNAQAVLTQAQAMLTQNGLFVERADYAYGDPATEICRYAETHAIEQIIMGAHGHHGLERLLLGSVTQGVFAKARQPVLVVRHPSPPA